MSLPARKPIRHVSSITYIRYMQIQNIEKPSNLNVFGNKKTKRPEQDSQI
jgi:hypothetical protein